MEQNPEISIRVLYQRDYLHLLVKYGLELPSQLAEAGIDENASPPVPFDLGRRPQTSPISSAPDSEAESA